MRRIQEGRRRDLPAVTHQDQVRLLGEISSGGLPALVNILRRARTGDDPAAAAMPLSSLLRAMPGMGSMTVHELIATERIREGQHVGDIAPGRIASLMRTFDR